MGDRWELVVERVREQRHPTTGRIRTIGRYQVFHDGVPQSRLKGWTAEPKGPGANTPGDNGLRIEAGRYPVATWGGERYVTIGYAESDNPLKCPKPALELRRTNQRTEILIHTGRNFLSSVGCINLCAALPNSSAKIDYADSRRRVIAMLDDLAAYVATRFPQTNGHPIANAWVVVEGEPISI